MQQYSNQQYNLLDMITIVSFFIGFYALSIGIENLKENREQSRSQSDLLKYLESHLQSQDDHLKAQDNLIKELQNRR